MVNNRRHNRDKLNNFPSQSFTRQSRFGRLWLVGKTIARQLANSQWLQLCAVAEIDQQARTSMLNDPALANVEVCDSPEKLMAHSPLDAVILCTPHQQHAQQMMMAAQANLHVFAKNLCA